MRASSGTAAADGQRPIVGREDTASAATSSATTARVRHIGRKPIARRQPDAVAARRERPRHFRPMAASPSASLRPAASGGGPRRAQGKSCHNCFLQRRASRHARCDAICLPCRAPRALPIAFVSFRRPRASSLRTLANFAIDSRVRAHAARVTSAANPYIRTMATDPNQNRHMAPTASRSSRASMRCASAPACTSATPTTARAFTTWCSRFRTMRSTRRSPAIATASSSS